jgi:hypothetical protein
VVDSDGYCTSIFADACSYINRHVNGSSIVDSFVELSVSGPHAIDFFGELMAKQHTQSTHPNVTPFIPMESVTLTIHTGRYTFIGCRISHLRINDIMAGNAVIPGVILLLDAESVTSDLLYRWNP